MDKYNKLIIDDGFEKWGKCFDAIYLAVIFSQEESTEEQKFVCLTDQVKLLVEL